jgi:hypothetical protein
MASDGDDDLDVLVRTAMKTLDEQVPSGYFEALPNRLLERLALEEGTMQAGSASGSEAKSSSATPSSGPQAAPKIEEDSGLHDIRSLAQTTKERISSKRITLSPTKSKSEEELLASASGSWKSLALPQPASMVSLPELAKLPPASVVETSKPMFAATVAQRQAPAKSHKLMAIAGLGIAAAAGVTLFVTMSSKSDVAAPKSSAPEAAAPIAVATATPPVTPPAAPVIQHIDEPAAGSAAVVVATAPPETEPDAPAKVVATKSRAKAIAAPTPAAHSAKPTAIASKDQAPAPTTAPEGKKAESGGKADKGDATGKAVANGQESLDQLIKEAGAEEKPKAGPTLDKKELSAGDFKAGMSAIQGKAQGCFKGTQGMASVKLVIVPSGKVTRVTVTGKFAGQPEAECVTAAVKSATFPAWDGGSQTMGYSFLLSE